jgi:prepilin signal peptidase PulO-like enzyme (type II secretory pathway)
MEMLVFFLLGLPAAVIAERAIHYLTSYEIEDEEDGVLLSRVLPWQKGRGQTLVRAGAAAVIPLLMALAAARFEPAQAAAVSLLLTALLVCTATDLLRYRVPDVITFPGIALSLAAALLMPEGQPLSAVLAAVLGGGMFLLMKVVVRRGLGLGDVKLVVLIGAALGLGPAYEALLLGLISAGVVLGVLFLLHKVQRRQGIPYAPFLALAAVAVVLTEGSAFAPL